MSDANRPAINKQEDQCFEAVASSGRGGVPQVTVIISLYNYQAYIRKCLDSVRDQTLAELDLVIVDDRSRDRSLEEAQGWLETHGERFNRYFLLQHKKNMGLADARNTAFRQARTELVFVLDADNWLYPRCLERLSAALANCEASFAYSYLQRFGEAHDLMNTDPWNPAVFQSGNRIDAMALIRKKVWERVGGYSRMEVMGWEDFDLWFKVARIGGWGVQVPEVLAKYRVHRTSMLNQISNPNAERLWAALLNSYPEFFTDDSLQGRIHAANQDWSKAAEAYQRAVQAAPDKRQLWLDLGQIYARLSWKAELQETLGRFLCRHPWAGNEVLDKFHTSLEDVQAGLERALDQRPHHPALLEAFSRAMFRQGDLDRAKGMAIRAHENAGRWVANLRDQIVSGELNEVKMELTQALYANPQDQELLHLHAMFLRRDGQWVEGLNLYQFLLNAGKTDESFLIDFLDFALETGNRMIALRLVEKLLACDLSAAGQNAARQLAEKWPDNLPLQSFAGIYLNGSLSPATLADSPDTVRACQTLDTLLQSEDIITALQENQDLLDSALLAVVQSNAASARADGDEELAEGLEDLAEYISQAIVDRDQADAAVLQR